MRRGSAMVEILLVILIIVVTVALFCPWQSAIARTDDGPYRITLYSGGQRVGEWIALEYDPTMSGCRFFDRDSGRRIAIVGTICAEQLRGPSKD